jgi:peptidoglycan hydrolase-like protein with peptidoglycan-binding domain
MIGIDKYCKNVALSVLVAGGLMGFAPALQAHGHAQNTVRSAQEQLKTDGYYKGDVDGIDGPSTQSAIRQYQRDNNLKVNGKLDRQTRKSLGVKGDTDDQAEANREATEANRRATETNRSTSEADRSVGDANRSTSEADRYQPGAAPSSATVTAAQRRLSAKGFYKGDFDGNYGPETRAAIREYQKNSNLNVTGRLDQATLNSLGVSK